MKLAYDAATGRIKRVVEDVDGANLDGLELTDVPDEAEINGKCIDPESGDLVDDPDHVEPVSRADLMADYREGKATVEQAREDFNAARDAAQNAETTAERADAIQSQIDVLATFLDAGLVPATDTLFRAQMGEEP